MRCNVKPIVTILLLMLCEVPAMAYDFEYDGLFYNILSEEDGTVEVTYRGIKSGGPFGGPYNDVRGDIIIPQSVIGFSKEYTVVAIGEDAFYGSAITSVDIPNTVVSIGDGAFSGVPLKDVILPNSITALGRYAFTGSKINSITLSNSLKTIRKGTFSRCDKLKAVVIPDSVMLIEEWAFCDAGIRAITLGKSVKSIADHNIRDCRYLEEIEVNPDNAYYSSLDGVLFNKDRTKLMDYPCGNARTEYVIPNSVTRIGKSAFSCNNNLTSIIIPETVTVIDTCAFDYSRKLKTLRIPKSVKSILCDPFTDCNISSVTIEGPQSRPETSIMYGFTGCSNLRKIYCPVSTPPWWGSFWDKLYEQATLYVPIGYKDVYESIDPWRKFMNIQEMAFSGNDEIYSDRNIDITVSGGVVKVIRNDENNPITIYDTSGRMVYNGYESIITNLSKGIYILHSNNEIIKFVL